MPTLYELLWDMDKYDSITIRAQRDNSTEAGVLGAQRFDIEGKWTPEQWKLFYDKADLLHGSDENPGALYAIDVYTLDTLLKTLVPGINYSELEDDRVGEVDEGDMRTSYKRVVVSLTDGGQLIVIS